MKLLLHLRQRRTSVAFRSEADMNRRARSPPSVANDPFRTWPKHGVEGAVASQWGDQPLMKASRSVLIIPASVVGMPCGKLL